MRIVYKQPFADDFLNIHPRIQGIVRILKDYLNVFAQIAPFFCRQKLQFSVVETDIALKRRQADNCRSQSGFTRTGFADNSQRRSLRQFKRNAVDRSQLLNRFSPQIFLQRKSNPDVFRAEQNFSLFVLLFQQHMRINQIFCISMGRIFKNPFDRSLFYHPSVFHHQHAIGDFSDYSQIMADKHNGHIQLFLQFIQ